MALRITTPGSDADRTYRVLMRRVDQLAGAVTGATQRGSLPSYLTVVLVVLLALPGTVLVATGDWPASWRLWDSPVQLLVAVLVAAAAALVISPAVFGLWGAKLARRRTRDAAEGRWYRFSHAVMRRPGTIADATAAVMVVLAAPAVQAEFTPVDGSVIPEDLSSRTVNDTLLEQYAGDGATPVTVAVSSTDAAAVDSFAAAASDGRDVRDMVDHLVELNDLDSVVLDVGQSLAVPVD